MPLVDVKADQSLAAAADAITTAGPAKIDAGNAAPGYAHANQSRDGARLKQRQAEDASGRRKEHENGSGSQKKMKLCRYFGTLTGCRAGENCLFLHDPSKLPSLAKVEDHETFGISATLGHEVHEPLPSRQQAVTEPVPTSRVVSKPIPQKQNQDPREFHLGQMRRRFSPKETQPPGNTGAKSDTILNFIMAPSDPDFPFEMNALQCSLVVPASYPGEDAGSRPRLKITNKDIPRGFAINVERGFDGLVEQRKHATLLSLISALDKNLEKFLSEKKVETVKLVPNADTRHLASLPVRSLGPPIEQPPTNKDAATLHTSVLNPKREEVFNLEQKNWAQEKRDRDTRQLEARMGRLSLYKKSTDGIAYTLPIEPWKRSELPLPLQSIKTAQLLVPLLYPLQSCRIKLEDIKPEDAKVTELNFELRASQEKDMTLMAHIAYLTHNIHSMAKNPVQSPPETAKTVLHEKEDAPSSSKALQSDTTKEETDDDTRHIKVIPRPPEWTANDLSNRSDTDDSYSYDSGDESEGGGIELEPLDVDTAALPERNSERGTAISFPFLELYGIELLEVTNLNLTIKCERCKEIMDIHNLKNNSPKIESCKKCAAILKVGFRRDLIHTNAIRAGFLDLEACTIIDMLPSTFIPTCSICSTPYPSPGVISVRGETSTIICRTCHQKLTFALPNVKFLRVTPGAEPMSTSGPRRKRDTLGLVTGTELPDRGRCRHYSKSYRWFRFSCCAKVYACDKCHDEKEKHPNEHANRMICGWCSREQSYRPEECAFCGRGVVGRKGSGFWEGGKGTRDRVRMSRKDPRKHKRVGGETKAKT